MKIPQIGGLSEIAGNYRAMLCDVWGVLHNGVHAHAHTVDALRRFRDAHGPVVMITNAPRPSTDVAGQFARLGVPDDAWDEIVSSGDVIRQELMKRRGAKVLRIGPDRDLNLFAGLDLEFVDEGAAEVIGCTGLVDDTAETPDDYRPLFERLVARDLPMICANPDVVVERGDQLVWCAGALAKLYESLGGTVIMAGKPHPPIYEASMARLGGATKDGVLAVGDGLSTDIRGANRFGLDVLFVTNGIHVADFGPPFAPDANKVAKRLAEEGLTATAYVPMLRWVAP